MRHRGHENPVERINDRHRDDLLIAARALTGHPNVTRARAERVDRRGIDLALDTPTGPASARIEFDEPVPPNRYPAGVRVAFVKLVRRARAALAAAANEPTDTQ